MLTINENMTDNEIKNKFYRSCIKLGLSETAAREKAEIDFINYKKMLFFIENPSDDVSILEIKKGGVITKKTGRLCGINTLNDL